MEKKILTVVIPAYNEYESLVVLLPNLIKYCNENEYNLIIVDDCSTDNTFSLLKQFESHKNFKIIRNKINLNYGGAIKKGISEVETEFALIMDADGQHDYTKIKEFLNYIIETNADMVIGARKIPIIKNIYRSLGKKIIKTISKILVPNDITDLNSGFKIFRTNIVKNNLSFFPSGMAFSDVLVLFFIYEKYKVVEKEIFIMDRKYGKSTINTLTAFETIIELLNIVTFFNPLRIFIPVSSFFVIIGVIWGFPHVLAGRGVSVGALLFFLIGIITFMMGLLSEQLSKIRKLFIK